MHNSKAFPCMHTLNFETLCYERHVETLCCERLVETSCVASAADGPGDFNTDAGSDPNLRPKEWLKIRAKDERGNDRFWETLHTRPPADRASAEKASAFLGKQRMFRRLDNPPPPGGRSARGGSGGRWRRIRGR